MDISYHYQNNIIKERSELVGRSDHSHKDLDLDLDLVAVGSIFWHPTVLKYCIYLPSMIPLIRGGLQMTVAVIAGFCCFALRLLVRCFCLLTTQPSSTLIPGEDWTREVLRFGFLHTMQQRECCDAFRYYDV